MVRFVLYHLCRCGLRRQHLVITLMRPCRAVIIAGIGDVHPGDDYEGTNHFSQRRDITQAHESMRCLVVTKTVHRSGPNGRPMIRVLPSAIHSASRANR